MSHRYASCLAVLPSFMLASSAGSAGTCIRIEDAQFAAADVLGTNGKANGLFAASPIGGAGHLSFSFGAYLLRVATDADLVAQ